MIQTKRSMSQKKKDQCGSTRPLIAAFFKGLAGTILGSNDDGVGPDGNKIRDPCGWAIQMPLIHPIPSHHITSQSCISIHPSFHQPTHPSIHPSIHLSTYPPIHLDCISQSIDCNSLPHKVTAPAELIFFGLKLFSVPVLASGTAAGTCRRIVEASCLHPSSLVAEGGSPSTEVPPYLK